MLKVQCIFKAVDDRQCFWWEGAHYIKIVNDRKHYNALNTDTYQQNWFSDELTVTIEEESC